MKLLAFAASSSRKSINKQLVTYAEHNCAYSVAYKNLLDWSSRIRKEIYFNKPAVLLATSPGGRGGASVLALASSSHPRFGADIRATLSIPSFYENFDVEKGVIINGEIGKQLQTALAVLQGGK